MTGLMLRSSLTGEAAKSRRALGLLAATLAYLGAGAVLFSALEYEQVRRKDGYRKVEARKFERTQTLIPKKSGKLTNVNIRGFQLGKPLKKP